MIHVIASIHLRPGCSPQFLEIFKRNMAFVQKEAGCLEYQPTMDLESGLPPQLLEPDVVVILEKWQDTGALRAYLGTPHMAAYRDAVKDLVLGMSLKVLQNA